MTNGKLTVDAGVVRGPQSWAYIYTVLGFLVTIESTVIGMMTPLTFPSNIVVFVVLAAISVWLFIESEWVHDKLLALKTRYESKAR
jgi:hypothetical protein